MVATIVVLVWAEGSIWVTAVTGWSGFSLIRYFLFLLLGIFRLTGGCPLVTLISKISAFYVLIYCTASGHPILGPFIIQYLLNKEGNLLTEITVCVCLGIKRCFLVNHLRGCTGRLTFVIARGAPPGCRKLRRCPQILSLVIFRPHHSALCYTVQYTSRPQCTPTLHCATPQCNYYRS